MFRIYLVFRAKIHLQISRIRVARLSICFGLQHWNFSHTMTLLKLATRSEGFDQQIRPEKHSEKLSGVKFLVLDLTSQLRLAPGSSYSDLNQIFADFKRAQKIENLTKSKYFCDAMFQMITEFIQPKKHIGVRCTLNPLYLIRSTLMFYIIR